MLRKLSEEELKRIESGTAVAIVLDVDQALQIAYQLKQGECGCAEGFRELLLEAFFNKKEDPVDYCELHLPFREELT